MAGAPGFQRDAKSSAKSLDRFGDRAKAADKRLSGLQGTMAKVARGGALFGAGLGAAVAGGLFAAVKGASNLNETLNKSQAVFGASAESVKAWAGDSTKNILQTKQAAIEGAATFGNLFVSMGIGTSKAAGLSTSLVGLAADLSSFNDVGTDEALLALRSGLLGEAEPLRKFGVQLSAARIEAEAMASGIVKPTKNLHAITAAQVGVQVATAAASKTYKKYGRDSLKSAAATVRVQRAQDALNKAMAGSKPTLTAAQKAQASYNIILEDTKIAQGDAADTSGSFANSMRRFQKATKDARDDLGMKLLPTATSLINWINNKAVPGLLDFADQFQNGTGRAGELRDTLRDVGDKALGAFRGIRDLVGFLSDHESVVKVAATTMAAYALALKSAALWGPLATGGAAAGGAAGGAAAGGAAAAARKSVARKAGIGGLIGGVAMELDQYLPDSLQTWRDAPALPKVPTPKRTPSGRSYTGNRELTGVSRSAGAIDTLIVQLVTPQKRVLGETIITDLEDRAARR